MANEVQTWKIFYGDVVEAEDGKGEFMLVADHKKIVGRTCLWEIQDPGTFFKTECGEMSRHFPLRESIYEFCPYCQARVKPG